MVFHPGFAHWMIGLVWGAYGVEVESVDIKGLSSITVCCKARKCLLQAVVGAEQTIYSGATYCWEMQFTVKAIILHSPSEYSWPLRGFLEGTRLCQTFVEEQAGAKGRGCWNCCFVWSRVLRMVLCRWNCGKGIHFHWLLCLRSSNWCVFRRVEFI